MRKIIVLSFITLDGVMQAPGGPEEDLTGDFKYGGWSMNYWDEMMTKVIMDEVLAKLFDLLLGRKTYDIFAAYWPYVKNDPDKLKTMIADKWNSARKYVVTKTLAKADWENSAPITGDAVKEIIELKKLGLKLLDCKTSTTGASIATYKRSGKIKTGSLALENPTEAELIRRKRLE